MRSTASCTRGASTSATSSRHRRGEIGRIPDAVVRPGDEETVRAVMSAAVDADAVVIPFGGGTNISGSLEAPTSEARPVISVDLGRMDAVLAVDADSGVARVQPGVFGSRLQQQWTSSSDAVAPFVVEMQ